MSLGLEWAGFRRIAAIEASPLAAHTYFHNLICRDESAVLPWQEFLNSRDLQRWVGLIVGPIEDRFDDFLDACRGRSRFPPDVIAGGPPCQGFSTAGKKDPCDPRNKLLDRMIDAVEALAPSVVLIENVPAMGAALRNSDLKGSVLDALLKKLNRLGYASTALRVDASLLGVPQTRPRLFVVGMRQDRVQSTGSAEWAAWESENALLGFVSKSASRVTVRDALGDLSGNGYRLGGRGEYGRLSYAKALRFDRALMVPAARRPGERTNTQDVQNHELRTHGERTVDRFRLYFRLRELQLNRRTLWAAALHGRERLSDVLRRQMDSRDLSNAEINRLVEELSDQIYEHPSKKHTQIVLDGDGPANTITTLPDDLVHYAEPRVLTVRELARLQSFPDSFVFKGKATTGGSKRKEEVPQYTQVGNAVAPLVARGVGQMLAKFLAEASVVGRPDTVELPEMNIPRVAATA